MGSSAKVNMESVARSICSMVVSGRSANSNIQLVAEVAEGMTGAASDVSGAERAGVACGVAAAEAF
jgi:hypothetical protein